MVADDGLKGGGAEKAPRSFYTNIPEFDATRNSHFPIRDLEPIDLGAGLFAGMILFGASMAIGFPLPVLPGGIGFAAVVTLAMVLRVGKPPGAVGDFFGSIWQRYFYRQFVYTHAPSDEEALKKFLKGKIPYED